MVAMVRRSQRLASHTVPSQSEQMGAAEAGAAAAGEALGRAHVGMLMHAFFCEHARCRETYCNATISVLVKMETHAHRCQAEECKICSLWKAFHKIEFQAEARGCIFRFDRTQPFWRHALEVERRAVAARHQQLMRLWRGIARCITPCVSPFLLNHAPIFSPPSTTHPTPDKLAPDCLRSAAFA